MVNLPERPSLELSARPDYYVVRLLTAFSLSIFLVCQLISNVFSVMTPRGAIACFFFLLLSPFEVLDVARELLGNRFVYRVSQLTLGELINETRKKKGTRVQDTILRPMRGRPNTVYGFLLYIVCRVYCNFSFNAQAFLCYQREDPTVRPVRRSPSR